MLRCLYMIIQGMKLVSNETKKKINFTYNEILKTILNTEK